MSCTGILKKENNKFILIKDYGENNKIEISFVPNQSMGMELQNGDKVELRVHRDLRKDSSVLYDGKLVKLDSGRYGYKYELEEPTRERLDHRGSYQFWITYEDAEGTGDLTLPTPHLGERLEVRVHVIERANNAAN